jgi:hypothetical protein
MSGSPRLIWKPKAALELHPKEGRTTQYVSETITPVTRHREVQQSEPLVDQTISTPPLLEAEGNAFDLTPPIPHQAASMANFVCDPTPFVPFGAFVEDGWQRPARTRVAIGGEPPRRHEEYAVVVLEPPPPAQHARVALDDVVNVLQQDFPVRIQSYHLSPLGLGLLEFGSTVQRQSMLDISPIAINESLLRVYKHDEAINLRACHYSRECWVMFLAFPLDYQTEGFMKEAVAPFGRVLFWRQCRNKSVSLVHCLLLDPSRVPRSIVLSQGTTTGANGRSWSIPTYILGGNVGMEVDDEDPIPVDGNPHPPRGSFGG